MGVCGWYLGVLFGLPVPGAHVSLQGGDYTSAVLTPVIQEWTCGVQDLCCFVQLPAHALLVFSYHFEHE